MSFDRMRIRGASSLSSGPRSCMTRWFRWVDRLATVRTLAVLFALEVVLLGCVNAFDFPLSGPFMQRMTGHKYLDMCAFCSAPGIYTELDGFGNMGRQVQLAMLLTIDIAIPLVSGLFGVVALSVLVKKEGFRWFLWVPVAAALLDYLENTGIATLLAGYPNHLNGVAAFTGWLSGVKFCAYSLTALLIVVFALRRLRGAFRARGR